MNSSFDSEHVLNDSSRDIENDLTKSRLSSASRKSAEQISRSLNNSLVNDNSNETRIKSPASSRYNENQLINDKQSSFHSSDNEEQAIFNHNSHYSSSYINQSNHDEQNKSNQHLMSSQHIQNQSISTKDSLELTTDDQIYHPRKTYNQQHSNNDGPKTDKLTSKENDIDDKKSEISQNDDSNDDHPSCLFCADKNWLNLQWYNSDTSNKGEEVESHPIKKPNDLENEMEDPSGNIDQDLLDRIQGSIIGMALGDALGAHVEFRPYSYMKANPVKDLEGGGTWGLQKGQFTDDTSMALCLANSLLARRDFIPYDQLVRYKWWYRFGYMSSTGQCFDIGAATSQSLREFEHRQKLFAKKHSLPLKKMDQLSDEIRLNEFDVYCSEPEVAGNGALMRLAPVPLFFFRNKYAAIEFSGRSGEITHGDKKSYDACRFYGALIVAALRGYKKEQILAKNFYSKHKHWFANEPLHEDIQQIAEGSFKKKGGYKKGIRGKGYIVKALEAALWAFWSDDGSFEKGALAAVNLGDDTDTTAAIYGQLAGAYYGYKNLPERWLQHVYAHKFLKTLAKWIAYEGEQWELKMRKSTTNK
ncbi:unnamed protein product [Rotaria sp. Silwood1]|nr:unnamed protein product [Rotaria sp. Silwood1]